MIERLRAQFSDDYADGTAAQGFFHGPEYICPARRNDRSQPFRSNAGIDETGCVRRAMLKQRKVVRDPNGRFAPGSLE